MKSTVETVYRVRVDYDIEGADVNRAQDFIEKVGRWCFYRTPKEVTVETFSGSPIFGPGILLECADKDCLVKFVERLERYILKWKGAKIE